MDGGIEKNPSRSRETDVFLNTAGTHRTEESDGLGEEVKVQGLLGATL